MRRIPSACGSALLCVLACAGATLLAQSVPMEGPASRTPLAVRQERVSRLMEDVESKLLALAQALQASEPQRAARLVEALHQARQQRLVSRMGQVVSLLNQEKLDAATAQQKEIVAQIESLIDLLVREQDDAGALHDEMQRLEAWRAAVEKLIAQQGRLRQENRLLEDPAGAADDLQNPIAALQAVLARQQALTGKTQAARNSAPQELPGLAQEQAQLRQDTQALDPAQADGDAQAPGVSVLGTATRSQQAAEEALAAGQGRTAQAQQEEAVRRLEEAIDQLEKDRQRITRLPPEHADELAGEQDATAQATDALAQEMAAAAQAAQGQGPSAESGEGQAGAQAQAAQQRLQQARQAMRQAAEQLRNRQPQPAGRAQKQALRELQDALDQIEERLAQLRQEMQMERLADLESRFRGMLERQKPVTLTTVSLHTKAPQWDRADRLACAGLGQEEMRLAELAERALLIIREDATTVVLPRIVDQLHQDLLTTGDLLARARTDALTQGLQQQIERTLEELIDAVQQAQEAAAQPPGEPGDAAQAGDEPSPLVPESAELKLLRAAQARINDRTLSIDQARAGRGDQDTVAQSRRASDMQQHVLEMAQDLAERR